MIKHPIDVRAMLLLIVGLGMFVGSNTKDIETLIGNGPWPHLILSAFGVAGIVASQYLRMIGAPSTTPPS